MTPAEHAAAVRAALEARHPEDHDWPSALGALIALAERATEAEREVTRSESKRHEATLRQRQAEARATELQRDVHAAWEVARAQTERAERAETALREILVHPKTVSGADMMHHIARVALGETAP